jgi:hypothetical protein
MAEKFFLRLPSGWLKVLLKFFRLNGRKKLANAAFHLMFRTEFTPDDEEACQVLWEKLF